MRVEVKGPEQQEGGVHALEVILDEESAGLLAREAAASGSSTVEDHVKALLLEAAGRER